MLMGEWVNCTLHRISEKQDLHILNGIPIMPLSMSD